MQNVPSTSVKTAVAIAAALTTATCAATSSAIYANNVENTDEHAPLMPATGWKYFRGSINKNHEKDVECCKIDGNNCSPSVRTMSTQTLASSSTAAGDSFIYGTWCVSGAVCCMCAIICCPCATGLCVYKNMKKH
jgi:hypothetical protein